MLVDLPPEILLQIIAHASSARALRDISLTCRALHELIEAEGWKTFVLTRFPSFPVPPIWKDAAHALTTLSRNWDRKSFLARDFEPFETRIHRIPQADSEILKGQWKRPHGQTMGYQPVIDSYETWTSNEWNSRKEVVMWGAGAKLMMKTTKRGRGVIHQWEAADNIERELGYDTWRNKIEWVSCHDPREHLEGRDDITTVNIIKPHQRDAEDASVFEEVITGRASGALSLLRLGRGIKESKVRQFDTQQALVRSADIAPDRSTLLAACLGDARAVLYQIYEAGEQVAPVSEVSCVSETEHSCRTWSCRFLSPHRLAIGRGVSKTLVHVYDVQPSGLSEKPIRSFGSGRTAKRKETSAYPIVSIPESTTSNETTGNAFFSGGYDGTIRLHDMRSPSDCESFISDPTDDSAVFSLLMIGRERIVAGGAINALLKIYDLRMAGGRVYSYLDARPDDHANSQVNQLGAWNLFAAPRESPNKWQRRQEGGPIYSLSRPSPSSTSLYIGRENSIMHLNFTSISDAHPDPVFGNSLRRRPDGSIDALKTWAHKDRVFNLSMYDQTSSGNIPLRMQCPIGRIPNSTSFTSGYDGRWMRV